MVVVSGRPWTSFTYWKSTVRLFFFKSYFQNLTFKLNFYVNTDTVDVSLVQFLNGALLAAAGVDFTTAALTGFFPVSRVQVTF
jgi:hypothetical protein